MSNDKLNEKEPIVFILPKSMEHREFAVTFNKHIDGLSKAFAIDMKDIQSAEPRTGISELIKHDERFSINLAYRRLTKYEPQV